MGAVRSPAARDEAAFTRAPQWAGPKSVRRRSIRLRITALLLVPMLSLLGLWGLAASITLGAALDKYSFSTTYEKMGLPGIFLVNQLQQERSLSVLYLSTHNGLDRQKLVGERARADAVQAAFRHGALSAKAQKAADGKTKQRLAEAIRRLDRLPGLRATVDSGRAKPLETINSYSTVLDGVIQMFNDLVIVNDLAIFEQGRALISVGNARAYMLREDALMTAAKAKGWHLTPTEHLAFVQWVANGRQEFDAGMADLGDSMRGPLQRLVGSADYRDFRNAETAIVNRRGTGLPAEAAGWQATTTRLSPMWEGAVTQSSLILDKLAKPIGQQVVRRLVLAGGIGLVAVVVSIILSLLAARSLAGELRRLQRAALNLAEDRIPQVVARLRRGEEVDVQAEAPPLPGSKTTEVSRVGDAFTKVQRTAIETAVRESYLRKGISRVFLNIAWRSQSLLHRQLRMLDEMERRNSDPAVLEDLFRLDHLTTRMRRHAEGLIILSGNAPGRAWSKPVPIDEVLRGAVAEVEDYTRMEVVVISEEAALLGEVVADVIHLLAELIENAAVFSPAPTEVQIRAEMGANGLAVDIIDRGIGLDPAELDALNLRLSQPPEFDLAVSDRLGLFVVARLAARHRIRVALQRSVYGGVSAVVLIPRELVVELEQPEDEQAADGTSALRPRPTEPIPVTPGPGHGNGRSPSTQTVTAALPRKPGPAAPPRKPPGPGSRAELPRRVRQASIAPELLNGAPPASATSDDTQAAWEERSAEASRDLFAALQAGWLRGRDEDEGPPEPMRGRRPSS